MTGSSTPKIYTIKCPRCGRNCTYGPANTFRPFCSERCKTSDIAAWASESYAVPGEPVSPEVLEGIEGMGTVPDDGDEGGLN